MTLIVIHAVAFLILLKNNIYHCKQNDYSTFGLERMILQHYNISYNSRFNILKGLNNSTCLPNVYFAGFPKSGTTFLNSALKGHPLVQNSIKEPHFLTRKWINGTNKSKVIDFSKYLSIYEKFCNNYFLREKRILIDASQSLSWEVRNDIDLASFIYNLNPHVKVILETRNPYDRIISDFFYFNKYNERTPSTLDKYLLPAIQQFEECFSNHFQLYQSFTSSSMQHLLSSLSDQDTNMKEAIQDMLCPCAYQPPNDIIFGVRIHISMYACHIRRWKHVIPSSQLQIIRFEDLHPASAHMINITLFVNSILAFLNLPTDLYDMHYLEDGNKNSNSDGDNNNRNSISYNSSKRYTYALPGDNVNNMHDNTLSRTSGFTHHATSYVSGDRSVAVSQTIGKRLKQNKGLNKQTPSDRASQLLRDFIGKYNCLFEVL